VEIYIVPFKKKRLVHPKMKISSSFTWLRVGSKPYLLIGNILFWWSTDNQ